MYNNRLNGKWSKNGDGPDKNEKEDVYYIEQPDFDDDETEFGGAEAYFNGKYKDKSRAIELASSMRGQWLMGMALYHLLVNLEDMQSDELTEQAVTIRADMDDVETLVEHLFPLYRNVIEREDEDE